MHLFVKANTMAALVILLVAAEIRRQLAAVPEPATIFLAGGLLVLFALFRRRVT
jgi:hypothetical protein